ncbi:MAG TPA: ATPase, T2SS/T4P/T4SS family [Acidimicrobiales bacterium]|nr:ATPase, T2SS/T4P/T4SS family [Acidimicrobiales bacterium]
MKAEESPLQHIEAAVQQRAKAADLDMSSPDAADRLRQLIAEELTDWAREHARGHRPYPLADPEALAARAYRNLAGYGPLDELLRDPDVWEIMVNGPAAIFVRRHRGPSGYHPDVFHDDRHVVRTLTKLLDDASSSHRKLDPSEGLQDAQLDDGSRLHIVHADLARGGHTMVNIRRFAGVAFRSLDELVATDTLTDTAARFLRACVQARASIVFAGAPGAGKTTLLSCCAAELDPSLRVVTAEEVFEVDVPLANVASLQTRASRPERQEVDLRRLVSGFLRMAPDIAIVGEVRDREALALLLTLSSGVKGFTTIHGGSARQALTRLRFVAQLADGDLPLAALNSLVAEAVDLVVHSVRTSEGPRINEIIAVEDHAGSLDAVPFTITDVFRRTGSDGMLRWTGEIPNRLGLLFDQAGLHVREIVDTTSQVAR